MGTNVMVKHKQKCFDLNSKQWGGEKAFGGMHFKHLNLGKRKISSRERMVMHVDRRVDLLVGGGKGSSESPTRWWEFGERSKVISTII